MKDKHLLLTFDMEEIEIPKEVEISIPQKEVFEISYKGAKIIDEILKKHGIKCTLFVTAKFGEKYPGLVRNLSKQGHEVALHGYTHSEDYTQMREEKVLKRLLEAKKILEGISGQKIVGFRMPRMSTPKYGILKQIGIRYDSSIHPTYVPRRYFNLFKPRKIHKKNGIIEIPVSVTPLLRLPFSWIWMRNMGLAYTKICTRLTLLDQNYINIYFHPWDFVDISKVPLFKPFPLLMKRNTGRRIQLLLERYLLWAKTQGMMPSTIREYLGV